MCSKCVYTPADTGKRPRNTGYSSQSIKARSKSAKITKKKKERKERERVKQEEKTWKRSMQKKKKKKKNMHSSIYFQACNCTGTSRACSFQFWKIRKQIFAQGRLHFASWSYCSSKRHVRFFPGYIEFEKCICKFEPCDSSRDKRGTDASGQLSELHRWSSISLPIFANSIVRARWIENVIDGYRRAIRVYLRMYITEINFYSINRTITPVLVY